MLGASLLLPARLTPSPSWIQAKPSSAAVCGLLLRGSLRGAGGCGLLEAGAGVRGCVDMRSHARKQRRSNASEAGARVADACLP